MSEEPPLSSLINEGTQDIDTFDIERLSIDDDQIATPDQSMSAVAQLSERETTIDIHVDILLLSPLVPPALQLNSEVLAIPPTPESPVAPPISSRPSPQHAPELPIRPSSRSSCHSNNRMPTVDNYMLKLINFREQQLVILTQNKNGPCPLISLCNVLLLNESISIPSHSTQITFNEILELLYEFIVTRETDLNWDEMKCMLEKMQDGLDVNVDFGGGFERQSREYSPFLSFGVNLTHGWLADPQDDESFRILISLCNGYNHALELCVEAREIEELMTARVKASFDNTALIDPAVLLHNTDRIHESLIITQFLNASASQLTVYGLLRMNELMQEGGLAVLFRNNHFATMTKHNGMLYTLVTDHGYLNTEEVVWETLESVDGDSEYVDAAYKRNRMQRAMSAQDELTEEQEYDYNNTL